MFFSQCLISKKGPLGTIWVAAHCLKRLKSEQIKQTDISSSVDKILQDGVPEVTYRILAYLLLGVVRIYSKKVDFLLSECCNARDNLNQLAGLKRRNDNTADVSTHSISIPERFELDTFDLEVSVDQEFSRRNVKAPEEIMLPDMLKMEGRTNEKYCCDGDLWSRTPIRDVFSPHLMDIDLDTAPSFGMSNKVSGLEKLHEIRFSLEERLESSIFCETAKESTADMQSNEGNESDEEQMRNPDTGEPKSLDKKLISSHESDREQSRRHESEKESHADMGYKGPDTDAEPIMNPDSGAGREPIDMLDKDNSIEKLCGTTSISEETVEPMFWSKAGKESSLQLASNLDCQTNGERKKHLDSGLSIREPETLVRSFDKEVDVESEELRLPEMIPTVKHAISITLDAPLNPKISGAASPDFLAVRTPSTKERARVVKKRKCLFDDTLVISNKDLKHWIGYSSDLVCKRRKVPHTAFHARQMDRISALPQSFLEPVIPCNPLVFKSLVSQKNFTTREPVETAEVHLNKITSETHVNQVVAASPVRDTSRAPTPIAPATPVTHSTSLRSYEVRGVSKPDTLVPACSSESIERDVAQSEDQDLRTCLVDEEINSSAGDINEKDKLSVRTSKVAKYLHQKFRVLRKQMGEPLVNLSQVLNGNTRKESARLFYEILVLKTGEYIYVKQKHAFDDILVTESPKLRNTFDTDGVGGSGA